MEWKRIPDEKSRAKRLLQRLEKYNLSLDDYQRLGEATEWRCWCCGRSKPLVIDHDHVTNQVRGLLCHGCNTGIGLLGDGSDGVLNAVRYLEMYEDAYKPIKQSRLP